MKKDNTIKQQNNFKIFNMKNYIITITKDLNKKTKVEVLASSKKQIIGNSKTQFGLGISKFTEKNIVLKSELPEYEKNFHYEVIDIHQSFFFF